jgi:hypothetical protein
MPTRPVDRAAYLAAQRQAEAGAMRLECDLLRAVLREARNTGWLVDHVFEQQQYAHRTCKGWPDLVLLRERVLFVELKSATGRLSADQQRVIAQLQRAGQYALVWRPADWASGLIQGVLR